MGKQSTTSKITAAVTGAIVTGFDHLIKLIDLTAGIQQSASDASIIELRLEMSSLEANANTFLKVADFDTFERLAKKWRAERMAEFSKRISGPDKGHVLNLIWNTNADGKSYCDCQTFRITDASTSEEIRYDASYSQFHLAMRSWFIRVAKQDPKAAFDALNLETGAAAEIRRLYAALLESEADASANDAAKKTVNGTGETDESGEPTPPADSPEWFLELWNAVNSVRRAARTLYVDAPDAAEKVLPPVTAQLQDMARAIGEEVRAAAKAAKDAKAA